jgi:hypothetical protein
MPPIRFVFLPIRGLRVMVMAASHMVMMLMRLVRRQRHASVIMTMTDNAHYQLYRLQGDRQRGNQNSVTEQHRINPWRSFLIGRIMSVVLSQVKCNSIAFSNADANSRTLHKSANYCEHQRFFTMRQSPLFDEESTHEHVAAILRRLPVQPPAHPRRA